MDDTSFSCSQGSEDNEETASNGGHARVFRDAKKRAIEIFKNIEKHTEETDKILSGCHENIDTISEEYRNIKAWFLDCRKVFEKEAMKAVVFGSTSCGKSTAINAILHKRVLACGMGHMTNCVFQIQGSEEIKKSIFRIDNGEEREIEHLEPYLDGEKKLKPESVVYVTCPTTDFQQLNPDVIILDCPGLDKTAEHDSIISSHCKDADVFVFVSDAKSTIHKTEFSFFDDMEDPTVFVLFNCWDLTEKNERERKRAPKVKEQHREVAVQLLLKSNKHLEKENLEDKIYFVSAEEYLEKHDKSKDYVFSAGFENREKDFRKFETEFWKCTTTSALHTRFKWRIANGKNRLEKLEKELKRISDFLEEKKNDLIAAHHMILQQEGNLQMIQESKVIKKCLTDMEKDNILKLAKACRVGNENMEDKREKWQKYYEDMHNSVEKTINKNIRELHEKYLEKMTKEEYQPPDILSIDGSKNKFKQSQSLENITFKAEEVDPTYSWSFAPITMLKRTMPRTFYKNQPTTSTGRAFLQLGVGIATVIGGFASVGLPLPVALVMRSMGPILSVCHHKYDKAQWKKENKFEYLEEQCAVSIQSQFEEQKSKLETKIQTIDEELQKFFSERLKNSKDAAVKRIENLEEFKKKMQELMLKKETMEAKEDLSSFENDYFPEDHTITRFFSDIRKKSKDAAGKSIEKVKELWGKNEGSVLKKKTMEAEEDLSSSENLPEDHTITRAQSALPDPSSPST